MTETVIAKEAIQAILESDVRDEELTPEARSALALKPRVLAVRARPDPPRMPWDQRQGEEDWAYLAFLTYRNAGVLRDLHKAFRHFTDAYGKERDFTYQQWLRSAALGEWEARAHAWDIQQITRNGEDTVIAYIQLLRGSLREALDAVTSGEIRPKSIREVIQLLEVAGSIIPQETVTTIQQTAVEERTPAIGA